MLPTNRDNRTVHGKFNHGMKVRHRFPSIKPDGKKLMDLTNLLYPTGRAWYLPESGVFKKMHEVINNSMIRVKSFTAEMMDSYFPDNENFNEEDCDFWEYKLGLSTSNSLPLSVRRDIILRKISFPRNIVARQSLSYIQSQIDIYGFNVKIYENIFYDQSGQPYHETPGNIITQSLLDTQHGGDTQHGEPTQHGKGSYDIIANKMDDEQYQIGGNQNLWATFFIASPNNLFEMATVPIKRKKEFKELILKLKPAHLVAFTLIKYE